MLSPDARSLYTGAVTPPPGYVFDQAIATSYSLDPETLLLLSAHMALARSPYAERENPIGLLESLRRLSGRLSVYVDRDHIKAPSRENPLYGLLEPVIAQVKAPRGGVFHPKIWVIRFVEPGADGSSLIRLLVLSRNITYDRSWDISLVLEGRPGGRFVASNRPLGEFLRSLPELAAEPVPEPMRRQAETLAGEVRKTKWELPGGFEKVSFHVTGTSRRRWEPPRSKRMAVISPFVTDDALSWLGERTDDLVAVISRPEELELLVPGTLRLSGKWLTLDDAAETEEGEDTPERDTLGLHAKVYVAEKGWDTVLYVGSANATGAAFLRRSNTEILVGLSGKRSRVGGIDSLLGEDGLGPVLIEHVPNEEPPVEPDPEDSVRRVIEAARDSLGEAGLKVVCEADGDAWRLALLASRPVELSGISGLEAWPITVARARAADAYGLGSSLEVELGRFATESVTGLIGFDLSAGEISFRMVLNLPVAGIPEDRDDAIFRCVLKKKEDFLRYVLLLLGDWAGGFGGREGVFVPKDGTGSAAGGFADETAVLEELVRAFSRDPDRLGDVAAVVNRLTLRGKASGAVPGEFLGLWSVFEAAMEEVRK